VYINTSIFPVNKETGGHIMKRRRELGYMPKGKVFYVDGKPELCSATGYEVCEDDSNLLSNWHNEYIDRNGGVHYE
jgi:hypothetical protein